MTGTSVEIYFFFFLWGTFVRSHLCEKGMENVAAFLQQEIFTFGAALKHKNELNFLGFLGKALGGPFFFFWFSVKEEKFHTTSFSLMCTNVANENKILDIP